MFVAATNMALDDDNSQIQNKSSMIESLLLMTMSNEITIII